MRGPGKHSAAARQASDQPDQENKYARVIQEAVQEKRTRQDLQDDRRPMYRASPPPWSPNGEP